MTTLTLKIPETMDGELAALANRQGVSKSALVRKAVSALLSQEQEPQEGSFLALAEDLAGCLEGPEDLSCHKRHLDGYGQ